MPTKEENNSQFPDVMVKFSVEELLDMQSRAETLAHVAPFEDWRIAYSQIATGAKALISMIEAETEEDDEF